MNDRIFDGFLNRQWEDGMALASASDLLELLPVSGNPPSRYIAQFHGKGLVCGTDGKVHELTHCAVGISFPSDYLRHCNPFEVLTWLGPANVFHPNIRFPVICVGLLEPGTTLVEILHRIFEIVTYQKVTMREDDALNRDACVWARCNQDRFPVDPRPLKRRGLNLRIQNADRAQS